MGSTATMPAGSTGIVTAAWCGSSCGGCTGAAAACGAGVASTRGACGAGSGSATAVVVPTEIGVGPDIGAGGGGGGRSRSTTTTLASTDNATVKADHIPCLTPHAFAIKHLELSYLRGSVPPGKTFVAWIQAVMAARRERPDPAASEILDAKDIVLVLNTDPHPNIRRPVNLTVKFKEALRSLG